MRALLEKLPSVKRVALVDALGYDGSEQAKGADWSSVTIADTKIANLIEGRVREQAYSLARTGTLSLPGFPNFVTRPLPDGDLALVESFYKKFEGFDDISEDLRKAMEEHDKKYNPQKKRVREDAGADESEESAAKRIKLVEHEEPLTSKDIAELQNPSVLNVSGTVRFIHEMESGDKIWAEVDEATTFLSGKLIASFGSGTFMDGKDAAKTLDSWIDIYFEWLL
ncbi:unnamed protein product [Symbiodinium sp. CCMP2592]|nr:unnamed protein product [Symbiodinium sp. CCMP2592]